MILDTIDKFSQMEALPDFARIIGSANLVVWENISTYLYLLLAAMIKGNHTNCAQFAAPMRLDWLFGRLANPQSAEGILDVLYCVLTESPEALNMINEQHIKSVISLLEKVGRDPKVNVSPAARPGGLVSALHPPRALPFRVPPPPLSKCEHGELPTF